MKVGTRVILKSYTISLPSGTNIKLLENMKGIVSDNFITGIKVDIITSDRNGNPYPGFSPPCTIMIPITDVEIDKQFYRDSKLNQLGIK